jgi:tyrosyl-tRNA synthetase
MTARFHGPAAAQSAREGFESRFSKGALPEDLEEVSVSGAPIGIGQLLREAGLVASGSEAMRNVEQGGVRIDGDKVSDKGLKLGAGIYVVQVGKRRAARVTVS